MEANILRYNGAGTITLELPKDVTQYNGFALPLHGGSLQRNTESTAFQEFGS